MFGHPILKVKLSLGSILISLFFLTLKKADYVVPDNQIFSTFLCLVFYPIKVVYLPFHFAVHQMETISFMNS